MLLDIGMANGIVYFRIKDIVGLQWIFICFHILMIWYMKEEICIQLLSSLNETPPGPAPDNWKVGRKALVAAYYDDIW